MKIAEVVPYLVRLYNAESQAIKDFPEDRRTTVALIGKPGKVCIPYRRGCELQTGIRQERQPDSFYKARFSSPFPSGCP